MIGFYDYTVVLTYISLLSSITGMISAIIGHTNLAVFCLAFSGLCDMFDGKVARTKENRTDDEKLFGVQIDSLCDVVCFGILPIIICFTLSPESHIVLTGVVLGFYGLCGVIRLAYYNVLETNRQKIEEGGNKCFHGLPITTISIFLPLIYVLGWVLEYELFSYLILGLLFIMGWLFIIDIKIPKPTGKVLNYIAIVAVIILAFFLIKYRTLGILKAIYKIKL